MTNILKEEYRISLLTKDYCSKYESFLLSLENTLFYSSPKFLNFIEDLLGCKCVCFLVLDSNNEIFGALPIMVKEGFYGPVANSLPYYGSNGGMIISNKINIEEKNIIRLLLESAYREYLKGQGCIASTIITSPFEQDVTWYEENWEYDFKDSRIGQATVLPNSNSNISENLLNMFEPPRPRNIRKAVKSGVSWYISHKKEDLDFLCKLHQENIISIGGIPKPERFFSLLPSFFKEDDYRLYVAQKDNRKIAALLLFYFNKTIEYYTPAIKEEFRTMQPLSLLIFEAMKKATLEGYRFWNWGGTWQTQNSLYDFKKRWGARDYPYFYYSKVYNKELLKLSREKLLNEYPNFYVLPFKELGK